ncbi:MAG TPA: DNA-3-methyladenine glycosylase I [Steroidobacteraceae bacterium]|nr:DNA-3-methyladenine glycosylase I [Steroidobacteraceae bacterium]
MVAADIARPVVRHDDGRWRCAWCGTDPLYIRYHDTEWGVPSHDEHHLFEMLCLEGAQAGLSWITILRKREGYRRAFDRFDAQRIARYTPRRIERLLEDPGIVRNRLKVEAFIANARAFLEVTSAGSFAELTWGFAPPRRRRSLRHREDIPASTRQSDALSRELARRGFKFVGTTIVYAFMQAVGMVDDHLARCWAASTRGAATLTARPRPRVPPRRSA